MTVSSSDPQKAACRSKVAMHFMCPWDRGGVMGASPGRVSLRPIVCPAAQATCSAVR